MNHDATPAPTTDPFDAPEPPEVPDAGDASGPPRPSGGLVQRFTVRYRAAGSGSGPLTLGQDNMIRCVLHDEPAHMTKQALWPVPDGTDLRAALAALRTLAERHAALRTVFPGDHFERQEERAQGEFAVAVVPAGPGEDHTALDALLRLPLGADPLDSTLADPTAEDLPCEDPAEDPAAPNPGSLDRTDPDLDALGQELGRRGRYRAFDLATDFPLRLTLLTVAGQPVRLVVVICHAHLDGTATALLFDEWLALAAGRELPPPAGPTPLEIAAAEGSKTGRRKASASLRHWERILRTRPLAIFADDRVTRSDAQLPTLIVRSTGAAADLARASQRTGAGPSTLLLACYAALVAHISGQHALVIAALSANRHRQALAPHIGTLAQDALVALDADSADLDDLIRRTQAAALAGYWHSTFDAEQVWRIIDDTAHLRGVRYARHMVVNDLSATVPSAALEAVRLPLGDPELSWLPAENNPTRIMLNIWRVIGCLDLTLHADPQLLPAADTERFARALLRLIALAAEGPVPLADLEQLTGLTPGRRDRPGWRLVDGCWIELPAVQALVARALDRACEITLVDQRLVAWIATGGRPLTAGQAHAAVLAALPGHDTAMAPHHYLIQDGGQTVSEGSGRSADTTDWQALLG
ncbi:hypothetical protein GCM10009665_56420 [Kitasatospora nipponensis]|uniref:Condensation domain-containing protein n=1 Tax=Kitasatospora nipponensis TaxID=258049 RepID=A0ABN1WQ90_9ACTN